MDATKDHIQTQLIIIKIVPLFSNFLQTANLSLYIGVYLQLRYLFLCFNGFGIKRTHIKLVKKNNNKFVSA